MILNMPVPQVGHTPFMALRPFAMVTSAASFMSRFALHFTQYASTAAAIGVEYYWVERADKVIIPSCQANSRWITALSGQGNAHVISTADRPSASLPCMILGNSVSLPNRNWDFRGMQLAVSSS